MIESGLHYGDIPVTAIRAAKLRATTRFLGVSIGINDDDWQQASRLPGWTRAHVATHVARNADALAAVVRGIAEGRTVAMYGPDRTEAIERGSERNGLELQIDLDTSAMGLNRAFDMLDERWDTPVGNCLLPRELILVRLNEVVLHLVDLDQGYRMGDLPEAEAHWLLDFNVRRLAGRPGMPSVVLATTAGERFEVGQQPVATVRGNAVDLLGWLTGRPTDGAVEGADSLAWPMVSR